MNILKLRKNNLYIVHNLFEVTYYGTFLKFSYDQNDLSGIGCIKEIIERDEYILNNFKNQKGKTFIDIGANIGVATIIMAKLNPESNVYSFEPCKEIYDILVENIALNNLTNVKAYNLAVGNKSTKQVELSVFNKMTGANSTCADTERFKNTYGNVTKQTVNCISFDEILKNDNINEVYLLKIDCEGAEFDIIYDSDLFKNKIVKNIVGEFHDLSYNNAVNKSHELIEYCKNFIEGIFKISVLKL